MIQQIILHILTPISARAPARTRPKTCLYCCLSSRYRAPPSNMLPMMRASQKMMVRRATCSICAPFLKIFTVAGSSTEHATASTPTKPKKTRNAFLQFRSYAIANNIVTGCVCGTAVTHSSKNADKVFPVHSSNGTKLDFKQQ